MLGVGLHAPMAVDAQPAVRVTPSPVPIPPAPSNRTVDVEWSGLRANTLVFVTFCKKSIGDPSFNVSFDCSSLSEVTPNGTPTGSGSVRFEVFRGQNPDGETPWGCFDAGEAPPAGVEAFSTCYVRVTERVVTNLEDDVETPVTFVNGPGPSNGTSSQSGLARPTDVYTEAEDGAAAPSGSGDAAVSESGDIGLVVPQSDDGAGISVTG